jgi:Co/Zn/Cd efflux system component
VLCEHDQGHHQTPPSLSLVEHAHPEHGLVDRSILRSRAGIRAVSWSLAILTVTALVQAFIYSRTLSVALLADLIHNFGDALTAIPLGLASSSAASAANGSPGSRSCSRSLSAPSSHSARPSSASSTRAPSHTYGSSPSQA